MRSTSKPVSHKKSPPEWHVAFQDMMPMIETHAKTAFRHLNREAREEAVQEAVCNACCAYARLVEQGKASLAYPSVLARYGVAQTKGGRKVGGHLNCRDVLSEYCQQRKSLSVKRLDKFNKEEDGWHEVIVEDRRTGPAEVAAMRLDFTAWLKSLPSRLRRIAEFLAMGETTAAAARRFRVSAGRISQIRKELFQAWYRFQGEEPTIVVA